MTLAAQAPQASAQGTDRPTRTTFVRLGNDANAILVEPVTPDPVRSHIAILVTHPERINNFNYMTGMTLPKYGYRVMMMNYYGPETVYEEFLSPIAAAIKVLRAQPGIDKVILVGHSTGTAEFSFYQDVAENGPKACQEAVRIYKCDGKGIENLPKADGLVLLDGNTGAPERTIAFNPAVDLEHPSRINPDLDMFNPKNGFDPKTKGATYSEAFKTKFFAAQAARLNLLIDKAQARLALIEKGQGEWKDDEPFVVPGSSRQSNGARLDLADVTISSRTRAPHLVLKADGSRPVEIIKSVMPPMSRPQDEGVLGATTMETSVRHFLSFYGQRVSSGYGMGVDNITGVEWRGTPNSMQGNVSGVRVPSLIMIATCANHIVLSEIAYDRSAAKDKEFVAVEGANHQMQACRPEYGDAFTRTFDYIDSWLTKAGRF